MHYATIAAPGWRNRAFRKRSDVEHLKNPFLRRLRLVSKEGRNFSTTIIADVETANQTREDYN
jgi:hypothetical protein